MIRTVASLLVFVTLQGLPLAQTPLGWGEKYVDQPLRPFAMRTAQGAVLTSKSLLGKVVVLDFWATWCKPCTILTAQLNRALAKYEPQGVQMIGVNFQEGLRPGNATKYWKEHGYRFPMTVGNDAYGKAVGAGNPTVIVVDQKGVVRGHWTAWTDTRAAEIEAKVKELLAHPENAGKVVENATPVAPTDEARMVEIGMDIWTARNRQNYPEMLAATDRVLGAHPEMREYLASSRFQALIHVDPKRAVEFGRAWRVWTDDNEDSLSTIGNETSQTKDAGPEANAYAVQAFDRLIQKVPTTDLSPIVHDLRGRCRFRSGDVTGARQDATRALALAKALPSVDPSTLAYLEGVLKTYRDAPDAAEKTVSPPSLPPVATPPSAPLPRAVAPVKLAVGLVAPSFQATTIAGKPVRFPADYRGKLVMLDFWATWCAPCMAEVPGLARAYGRYRGQGMDILSVSLDREGTGKTVRETTRAKGMTWPQIYDGRYWEAQVALRYNVIGIPAAYLIDGDTGKILAAGEDLRGERLAATIEKALRAKGMAARSGK